MLVQRHLDGALTQRGFRLTPQPPADSDDQRPSAVYEAHPDDFGERYPPLDARVRGNAPCVDLWVHLDPSTGLITSELEGVSPEELLARFRLDDPAQLEPVSRDPDVQLGGLASRIAAILDAASRHRSQ